jgi:hypothetical protein
VQEAYVEEWEVQEMTPKSEEVQEADDEGVGQCKRHGLGTRRVQEHH